jgi:hypothetical protein
MRKVSVVLGFDCKFSLIADSSTTVADEIEDEAVADDESVAELEAELGEQGM